MLKIDTIPEGNDIRVVFHGNIDLAHVEDVRRQMESLAQMETQKYILDFQGVEYVDSAGLGALVTFYKIRKNRDIIFHNVNDRVKKLFQITRLDSIFRME